MTKTAISPLNALLMLTVIVFWGSSFVVVKIIVGNGLTPIAVATFRFLVAGALFLVVLLFKKSRERSYRLLIEKKDSLTLLLLSLTGVTFFFIMQYTGIKMAGASIAAIFVTLLSPILIAVLSAKVLQEHLSRKQVLGIGIAAAGTFLVIAGGTVSFSNNMEFFVGSLILLSTPVLWAIYNLLGKRVIEKYDAFLIVAYVTILGGLCLVPFSLVEGSFYQITAMTISSWALVLFLSIACSLFGYYIWFYVLKQVGATVTSSFLFVEPIVTVILARAFVGEEVRWFTFIGGFLIFLGVYLITTNKTVEL